MGFKENESFEPFFIVGCGRSGTTLLAVLLNRHSLLAVPPETDFFHTVLPRLRVEQICLRGAPNRHVALTEVLFSGRCLWWVDELNLNRQALLTRFSGYPPNPAHLLRSMLEEYAHRQGKPCVGEKTPSHLHDVPHILHWYPRAKIVCIVRDGRDVASSLQKVPWASNNLRRNSFEWQQCAVLTRRFEKRYKSQFLRVHYEDLIAAPHQTLQHIARFLGVEPENAQLVASDAAGPVPEREAGWKAKAKQDIDPGRVEAWRTTCTRTEQHLMNSVMGAELRRLGYKDTHLNGCPPWQRLQHQGLNAFYGVCFHLSLWHRANSLRTAMQEEQATRAGFFQWLRLFRKYASSQANAKG